MCLPPFFFFFFFNDTATTEIYTLSLHDALPISSFTLRAARSVGSMTRIHVAWRRARHSSRHSASHGSSAGWHRSRTEAEQHQSGTHNEQGRCFHGLLLQRPSGISFTPTLSPMILAALPSPVECCQAPTAMMAAQRLCSAPA